VELKSLLEESRFAGWDFRLVDEVVAAGTLTETGGEPTVIQPVEEGSFCASEVRIFYRFPEFTRNNLERRRKLGRSSICRGATTQRPMTAQWFPMLEVLRGVKPPKDADVFAIPSAAATAASDSCAGIEAGGTATPGGNLLQPVSEAGRAGIEELKAQTAQLLAFQNVGNRLFNTQVAFRLMDRFGAVVASLVAARERVRAEVKACVTGESHQSSAAACARARLLRNGVLGMLELDSGVNQREYRGSVQECWLRHHRRKGRSKQPEPLQAKISFNWQRRNPIRRKPEPGVSGERRILIFGYRLGMRKLRRSWRNERKVFFA